MKLKIAVLGLGVAVAVLGFGSTGYAFHAGGVAECGGCHKMHEATSDSNHLLVATDGSSACLTCHQHAGDTGPSSYHISTADSDMPAGVAPLQRTPGGDFGWVKKTYTYVLRGETMVEEGDAHGHNIVAADFGYEADVHNTIAPGGTMQSAALGCESCHDPHGQYRRLPNGTISTTGGAIVSSGSYHNNADPTTAGTAVGVYRILAGKGYDRVPGVTFTADPPMAVAPSSYNRTEANTQTRVAYGRGMSEWCATCHPSMHSGNVGNFTHPTARAFGSTMAETYNNYVGSGRLNVANPKAYLSLVPFEEGLGATYATLRSHAKTDDSYLVGATGNSQVMCLSCHRAHASGFSHAMRWNMEGELMIVGGSWPGSDAPVAAAADVKWAQGRTYAETKAAYNDYKDPINQGADKPYFGDNQRVLCNKCHAKD